MLILFWLHTNKLLKLVSIITSQVKWKLKCWPVFHNLNHNQKLSWLSDQKEVYQSNSKLPKWTWIVWETVLFLCLASTYPAWGIIQRETNTDLTYRFLPHLLLMTDSLMWALYVLYTEVCRGIPPCEGEYAWSDEEEIERDEDASFCNSSTFLCSSARRYSSSFRFWCTGICGLMWGFQRT